MANINAMTAGAVQGKRDRKIKLLPDPEQRERLIAGLVSVDDHVIEKADVFVSRMPKKLLDSAPQIVEAEDGTQLWRFEGELLPQIGLSAVAGRSPADYDSEPTRFDEMRPGCYDAKERVNDMDLALVDASLNFPSMVPGFAGTKFAQTKDPEVGAAAVRAWNDWIHEEWVSLYPTRFIPLGITYLADPEIGAAEIRRNADRDFKAVSLPELPVPAGLPSLHTGYWDPIVRACVETDTVICLHIGSSTTTTISSPDAPTEATSALFPVNAQIAVSDWVYSMIPLRFPEVKIAMSEGGAGWVPALIDRMEKIFEQPYLKAWGKFGQHSDIRPGDVVRRNFWFCAIDEPSTWSMRDLIGIKHLLTETDYPHTDSSWPDSQAVLHGQLGDLTSEELELVTWKNACELFRHDLGNVSGHPTNGYGTISGVPNQQPSAIRR
jgi:predicted TIM-barrel fold metal-dependent hydrolase